MLRFMTVPYNHNYGLTNYIYTASGCLDREMNSDRCKGSLDGTQELREFKTAPIHRGTTK
jgi:hypothetical protein